MSRKPLKTTFNLELQFDSLAMFVAFSNLKLQTLYLNPEWFSWQCKYEALLFLSMLSLTLFSYSALLHIYYFVSLFKCSYFFPLHFSLCTSLFIFSQNWVIGVRGFTSLNSFWLILLLLLLFVYDVLFCGFDRCLWLCLFNKIYSIHQ